MKNIFILILIFVFSFTLFSQDLKKEKKLTIYPVEFSVDTLDICAIKNKADNFFPDDAFKDRYSKLKWLNQLSSFYDSYKSSLYKIEFYMIDNSADVIIYTNDNMKYYFSPYRNQDNNPDKKFITNFYNYSKGNKKIEHSGVNFFGSINYDFFYSIYGTDENKIHDNLEKVNIFGRHLPFNSKNNASFYLKKTINEINEIAKNDKDVEKWIKNLKNIYTYSNRKVANEDRPSLHSFGIAVDFVPRNYKKNIYWLWSTYFFSEWWNLTDDQKVYVPQKVIDTFEQNGFCWGGKWFRFDNMHFEYRPEILLNLN